MDSNKRTKRRENQPDWRNTLYQFHAVAVPKFNLTSQEIAVFTSLLSRVRANGRIRRSNEGLMKDSGIGNRRTLIKAKKRLVEVGILTVVERGVAKRKNTTYKVKLIGRPQKENKKPESELPAKVPPIEPITGSSASSQLGAKVPPIDDSISGKTATHELGAKLPHRT